MNRDEAEKQLTEWAANNAHRDDLVRAALAAGVSKNRIHTLTGIARTTIDRILEVPMDKIDKYILETITEDFRKELHATNYQDHMSSEDRMGARLQEIRTGIYHVTGPRGTVSVRPTSEGIHITSDQGTETMPWSCGRGLVEVRAAVRRIAELTGITT